MTLSDQTLPVSIVYRSRGSLLMCGRSAQVQAVLPLLPPSLKVLAVARETTGGIAAAKSQRQVVPGTLIQVSGHLGRFRASAAGPQGALDLGPLSPNGDGLFDLVLDLYERPLIDFEVPPLGYARTRGSSAEPELRKKIERLAACVGTINKPRYFSFDEARCAYDRQGVTGCRRCRDACPAGAMGSDGQSIVVDPYLCRGCGSCTLVCPTGAVRYARPRPSVTLELMAELLADRGQATDSAPVLVIHAGEQEATGIPAGIRSLRVTALGSVGMELWAAALALGASRVLILRSGLLPPTAARLIEDQLSLTRQLLRTLGESPERIRLVNDTQGIDWQGLANAWPAAELDRLAKAAQKRSLLRAALGHLAWHLPKRCGTLKLDVGAPFGTLAIDGRRCTLCHACVRLCPTGALRNPQGALSFTEGACVQCNLCVNACPEHALSAEIRFDPASALSQSERVLKPASDLFCCVRCGVPFAPRSLVEGSAAHVRGHPMFQGDGLRLLQMCMSCRQKESAGATGRF